MAGKGWNDSIGLGESDVHTLREFLRQACLQLEDDIDDFYESLDSLDLTPGKHVWKGKERPVTGMGYFVCPSSRGSFKSTSVFPYVSSRLLDIGVSRYLRAGIIEELLREPLLVSRHYAYFRKGKVCFLTEDLHLKEMQGVKELAAVSLSRAEAYALLAGKPLKGTRYKLYRVFRMQEGEDGNG